MRWRPNKAFIPPSPPPPPEGFEKLYILPSYTPGRASLRIPTGLGGSTQTTSILLHYRSGPSGAVKPSHSTRSGSEQHLRPQWVVFQACSSGCCWCVCPGGGAACRLRTAAAAAGGSFRVSVFVHTAPGWCRAQKPNVLLFTSSECVCVCFWEKTDTHGRYWPTGCLCGGRELRSSPGSSTRPESRAGPQPPDRSHLSASAEKRDD